MNRLTPFRVQTAIVAILAILLAVEMIGHSETRRELRECQKELEDQRYAFRIVERALRRPAQAVEVPLPTLEELIGKEAVDALKSDY